MLRISLLYELVALVGYAICCFDIFMRVEFNVTNKFIRQVRVETYIAHQ